MLVQAALLPAQSVERLLQVSAFVISTYNTVKRVDKPFRSLQNSTFELVYPEKGIRAIGEKVTFVSGHIASTLAMFFFCGRKSRSRDHSFLHHTTL